jgi:hypothetical protein
MKNKSLLKASTHKQNIFKDLKNGGISSTFEYDGIIASYIKELRSDNLPINTTDVILYAKEIVTKFKDRTLNSLRNWVSRFIKRMGICYRVITKTQTKLKDNIFEYVNKYYSILRGIISDKNLLNSIQNIGNADETPIFMKMNEKKL